MIPEDAVDCVIVEYFIKNELNTSHFVIKGCWNDSSGL